MKYTRTNVVAYDSYRQRVKKTWADAEAHPQLRALDVEFLLVQLVSSWSSRYLHRMHAIHRWTLDNLDPVLRDSFASHLLKRRNHRDNSSFTRIAGFSEEDIGVADQVCIASGNMDIKNFTEAPVYGKSFQRVLAEALASEFSIDRPEQLLNHFVDLSIAPAPVWARDDSRKAAALPLIEAEVSRRLALRVQWNRTESLEIPWEAQVDEERWEVRLNDFPEEWMYSLLVNGEVLGDFHDWPRNWNRGEEYWPEAVVKVKKAKVMPAVNLAPAKWLDRYSKGECAAVWTEMQSLGDEVRKKKYLPFAESVAQETMRRVKTNTTTLIQRLESIGFQPKFGKWGEPTPESELLLIPQAEKAKLFLPLSLREMMKEVGMVGFVGSHPAISPPDGSVAIDGLEIASGLGWEGLVENWMETPKSEREEEEFDVFPDAEGKLQMLEGAEPDGWLSVTLPNASADAVLTGEEAGRSIVEYLRWSLFWGGFPGWEKEKKWPEKELRFLRDGLIEI